MFRPFSLVNFIGVFLCALFLLSCDDRKGDESGDFRGSETYLENAIEALERSDPEVKYPEFERQERVTRIYGLDVQLTPDGIGFEICAECHGGEGYGSRDGKIPRLAGQNRYVLIERMVEIDEGLRHPHGMEELAEHFESDERIGLFAGQLSALPDPPDVLKGTGVNLELGKDLFKQYCVDCHGEQGRGDDLIRIPRIGGWDYEAIRRTLVNQKTNQIAIHEPGMRDIVSMFSDMDIEAVSDYVSRL
jgi:cytochrome c553